MNDYDVKNIHVVKKLLDEGETGDALYLFLADALKNAESYGFYPANKQTIDSLSKNILTGLKQRIFKLSNPMQASLILFGMQHELNKIESLALAPKTVD